jgi:FKBP-type peptidyl-prolyl cis-trans isomerase SlyD
MKITHGVVAAIDYTLSDAEGRVLDSSDGLPPLEYLHGFQNIIPGLERRLENLAAGAGVRVVVPPAEGYGERDERLVMTVPREQFPPEDDVRPGMKFQGQINGGVHVLRIISVGDDTVVVDANDELAGAELHFSVKVVSVRAATPEELANGRPRQAHACCGGHGHHHGGGHCKHGHDHHHGA